MPKVHEDQFGPYLWCGTKCRPVGLTRFKAGQEVKALHKAQSALVRVHLGKDQEWWTATGVYQGEEPSDEAGLIAYYRVRTSRSFPLLFKGKISPETKELADKWWTKQKS